MLQGARSSVRRTVSIHSPAFSGRVADLIGLRTLDAPRILSVLAGVVVTVAVYACGRRLTTRGNALLASDAAIRPAHGELADAGFTADRLTVTRARGVLAGEELLGWLHDRAVAALSVSGSL